MSRCVLAIASAAMWACGAEGDAVAESGSSAGQDTGTDGRSVEDARIGDDAGIDAAADMGGDGETGGSPADDAGQPEGTTCTGAPGDGTETLLDLGYDPPPGAAGALTTLDLVRCRGAAPRPLALLVHGGSWVGGDKANFRTAAPDFIPWWLGRGYVVAAVNFRLASPLGRPLEVGPMDQARDIAHALAWLNDHADNYGIDPQQTIAVGYSSGAHLVALLGADGRYLSEVGLPEEHITATVSLDVHAYDVPFALGLMVGSVVQDNIPLIEHLFGDTEAEQREASPIAYIDGYIAPALLVSVQPSPSEPGTHGYIVSQAAAHYADALIAAGHVAVTHHDSDESHASLAMGFGADSDGVTEAVGRFLDTLR
jgi:acetyl esterase/lipase